MTQTQTANSSSAMAFEFVQMLARELSVGRIELPSFPDVAVRVRQVLSDEFVSSAQLVKVVSTEPALAGKLLTVANSAALNPSGPRLTDLKGAITRIGFNMVRSASLAFAMEQIKKSEALAGLRKPLTELWERSVHVAALCYVVARRCSQVNADTALLTGLMHGMGRLYILTRAAKHPALFADAPVYNQIVRDWHAGIAKAILENWEMNEEIIQAVADYENLDRSHVGYTDLTDVLTVASLIATFHEFPESLEINMQGVKAFERMKLDHDSVMKILADSAREVASLRSALGA